MIGVLDLQGDVVEHLDHLDRLGVSARRVKDRSDLANLQGLIIPGGESTCLARLLVIFGLDAAIRSAYRRGMKIWGTCAGAILLASRVMGGKAHLGLIDMEIERNGFGSQLDSFTGRAVIPKVSKVPVPLIFIRAPKIRSVGPGVEILWQAEDYIAAVETREGLATVFHPELTNNLAFHSYFARKCGLDIDTRPASPSEEDSSWTITSWTRHMRIAPG
ncbi:MAG TPA: pyridoxal 5'-phosphate synthase glutaminase subunit PdxT [Syntrophales bacterium]|nr:pyridoxal 5'-phosphate synthase glutaminase subunit PdxT [Syntrophales bacterium]HOH73450.1 pyridoxal 5'-phosphate synthase glutaminase subunit PdxT [Syntrophales bacterium]HPN08738.1 pyridoxal 5'-phosphate synthase glutaminase subunit PdxT [Syntrophales bacterium]HPX82199.1 pyridoxal 5'-phosphate synthase glutaminase subunit PdxT [Syntrophales bacterium]HQB14060.1 pyridoxal 5'-phosphate synthase glutaminase subunit PdxT [Syntrophales bacterium]